MQDSEPWRGYVAIHLQSGTYGTQERCLVLDKRGESQGSVQQCEHNLSCIRLFSIVCPKGSLPLLQQENHR